MTITIEELLDLKHTAEDFKTFRIQLIDLGLDVDDVLIGGELKSVVVRDIPVDSTSIPESFCFNKVDFE